MTLYKLTSLLGVIVFFLMILISYIEYRKEKEAKTLGIKVDCECILSLTFAILTAVYFIFFSNFFSAAVNIILLIIFTIYFFKSSSFESFFKINVDTNTGKFLEEGELVLKKIAGTYQKGQVNILLTNRYVRIVNSKNSINLSYEDIFFAGFTIISNTLLKNQKYIILIRTFDEKYVIRANQLHIADIYTIFINDLKENIYDYNYRIKKQLRSNYKVK